MTHPDASVLILDFGSQVTQLIARRIREAGVYAGMPLKPARLWRKAMAKLYAGLS